MRTLRFATSEAHKSDEDEKYRDCKPSEPGEVEEVLLPPVVVVAAELQSWVVEGGEAARVAKICQIGAG